MCRASPWRKLLLARWLKRRASPWPPSTCSAPSPGPLARPVRALALLCCARSTDWQPCCCAGRAGSCELMIGCVAQAASDQLKPDFDEMEDVRWVQPAAWLSPAHEADSICSCQVGVKGASVPGTGRVQLRRQPISRCAPLWLCPRCCRDSVTGAQLKPTALQAVSRRALWISSSHLPGQ